MHRKKQKWLIFEYYVDVNYCPIRQCTKETDELLTIDDISVTIMLKKKLEWEADKTPSAPYS